jgi:hypothetical protein
VLCQLILIGASKLHTDARFPLKRWRSKMKTIIAALALILLAAGPVFAQTIIQNPQPGYYGAAHNSPALTGGGSFGHNRLQQDLGN